MIRPMVVFLLFAGSALLAFCIGSGAIRDKAPAGFPIVKGISPQKEMPLAEYRSFAIAIVAHNASAWCERALRSVFEQDYDYFRVLFIDDGSMDTTFEKAQQFIIDHHLEDRVVAMRNEIKAGSTACLYRAAQSCLDKEILLPLDACNWLASETVLSRLNQAFQNPDVWLAFGKTIDYPSYRMKESASCANAACLAFYAALFKSIRLSDLFSNGSFSEQLAAWQLPLFEQAAGRYRSLSDPFVFENRAVSARKIAQAKLDSRTPYRPLSKLPLPSSAYNESADLLLFSYDRPLQAYAALESIQRYLQGAASVTLFYRASDARFQTAYQELLKSFPAVRAVKQSDHPRKDFKPLLEKILFNSSAAYVLFCADDDVMTGTVDLSFCCRALEKTGAYAFYLRFGRNIQHSYIAGKPLALPPCAELGGGVLAWDLRKGDADWGVANNLEMTLYCKSDLRPHWLEISYKNPQMLQEEWMQLLPEVPIGLCFEQSKMVSLPLNAMQASGKPNMNYMTVEELLLKFNQGFKIDIEPLYQVNNPAPHYEWVPELIQR